ncbi:MAG: alpha/beta fold hydrolase [Candidatus Acidiferrales bacterium]
MRSARIGNALFLLAILCATVAGSAGAQSAPQIRVQSGFVPVSGSKLYYEAAGLGLPVVLVHGGQMDSRMWDEQFALFSKHYRVIRYDVRGFGKSPASTNVYADEDDLAALLKFLHADKAVIIGLSLGGRIAIDFALTYPEMTYAIIPVAPGLSGFNFSSDPTFMESWRAAQAGDWDKVTDLWLQSGYMTPAMKNPKIALHLRQLARENAHENLDNYLLEKVLYPPAIGRLREIKSPVLVIVGNLDVPDIQEISGLLRARIPRVKEIVIENSGHIVNMEQPEQFNRAVLDFLDSFPQ